MRNEHVKIKLFLTLATGKKFFEQLIRSYCLGFNIYVYIRWETKCEVASVRKVTKASTGQKTRDGVDRLDSLDRLYQNL